MKVSCFICDVVIYEGEESKPIVKILKDYESDKCKNCGHPLSATPKQVYLNGEFFQLEENPNPNKSLKRWWTRNEREGKKEKTHSPKR